MGQGRTEQGKDGPDGAVKRVDWARKGVRSVMVAHAISQPPSWA